MQSHHGEKQPATTTCAHRARCSGGELIMMVRRRSRRATVVAEQLLAEEDRRCLWLCARARTGGASPPCRGPVKDDHHVRLSLPGPKPAENRR